MSTFFDFPLECRLYLYWLQLYENKKKLFNLLFQHYIIFFPNEKKKELCSPWYFQCDVINGKQIEILLCNLGENTNLFSLQHFLIFTFNHNMLFCKDMTCCLSRNKHQQNRIHYKDWMNWMHTLLIVEMNWNAFNTNEYQY